MELGWFGTVGYFYEMTLNMNCMYIANSCIDSDNEVPQDLCISGISVEWYDVSFVLILG